MYESESAGIRELDLSNGLELMEVLELQKSSYAVEAALIGSSDIPPLNDTLRTLESCGETFYGYILEGEIVAAISYKTVEGGVDIHRLVVSPDHFRKGIARSLVSHVASVERGADRLLVSTGTDNFPAKNLYRSLGFQEAAESEVAPGLRATFFEKDLGRVSKDGEVSGLVEGVSVLDPSERGSCDDCR